MGGVSLWESGNKIAKLSRNKLDLLNKMKQVVSACGNISLTCNLTSDVNSKRKNICITAYKVDLREANSASACTSLYRVGYLFGGQCEILERWFLKNLVSWLA